MCKMRRSEHIARRIFISERATKRVAQRKRMRKKGGGGAAGTEAERERGHENEREPKRERCLPKLNGITFTTL